MTYFKSNCLSTKTTWVPTIILPRHCFILFCLPWCFTILKLLQNELSCKAENLSHVMEYLYPEKFCPESRKYLIQCITKNVFHSTVSHFNFLFQVLVFCLQRKATIIDIFIKIQKLPHWRVIYHQEVIRLLTRYFAKLFWWKRANSCKQWDIFKSKNWDN